MVRLTDVFRFYRTETRRFKFWPPNMSAMDANNWRTRLALIYAVSAWTMIGSAAFIYWKSDKPKNISETAEDNAQDPVQSQDTDIQDIQEKRYSFYTEAVYKENFVPYTTRIWQYFNSSDSSSTDK